jgi:glycosyltransferase involved in cell wall biosynthesis
MKILFLLSYYYPENVASTYLFKNLMEKISKNDFLVSLIVPSPTRGIKSQKTYDEKSLKREKLYDGKLIIHRFSMFHEGKNSFLRAIRYLLCHINHFYKGIHAKDIDVLFIASTPPTQGAMGALVKKIKKIPMVYNLQDIFPDSLVATGLTHKKSLLWRIGRVIENFTYRNADKIIVISEDFKKNIMDKGVPESKIEVIYNWVDEKAVVPISRNENKLFDELGLPRDLFYVVYAGNLGHAQNIEIIIEAAKKLNNFDAIKFIIFGSGGLENELKNKVANLKIENLHFFPIQPSEKISEVYSLGNAAIVSCKPGLGKSAMPSKTWSIMSSATAVLANFDEDTELQRIIENQQVGLFTNAGNVDKFVEAVLNLYQNPNKCDEFGKNGRAFILKNLTREIGTSKYVEVIKSVVQAHKLSKK